MRSLITGEAFLAIAASEFEAGANASEGRKVSELELWLQIAASRPECPKIAKNVALRRPSLNQRWPGDGSASSIGAILGV